MSWSDLMKLTKSISVFDPAMGQSTKEDNMNTEQIAHDPISPAMAEAHTLNIPAIGSPEMDAFISQVQANKEEGELVQTEEDVGGTPL